MSIVVNHLSKIYGEQKAVNDISFEVQPGEILGFLGPNGAGKSTTMKMLTCFIPPTSGNAQICGFDVEKSPIEVKKRVGYLPELNPLYTEMYVKEYLYFMADIHQMGGAGKKATEEIIEKVGLTQEQSKKIGQLSKGYKQRVGLAQAMIHNPDVLILDEPTSGLDPNQIVDIRNLIKEFGKNKTVILSTHIMQEVQAMCSKVIIINKGVLVANSDVLSLNQLKSDDFIFTVEFSQAIEEKILSSINSVTGINKVGLNMYRIQANTDCREQLFKLAVEHNLGLLSLNKEEQSLEELFRKLTLESNT
ncbi:MAG: gliding motility-associated ABC transporter ATP-binding subunit GldA [Bacteroidetes bacterium]|nr:gliding motility-associated ABC transporter ATP-binding subunit GldA [Bacteroidota bacterium]